MYVYTYMYMLTYFYYIYPLPLELGYLTIFNYSHRVNVQELAASAGIGKQYSIILQCRYFLIEH